MVLRKFSPWGEGSVLHAFYFPTVITAFLTQSQSPGWGGGGARFRAPLRWEDSYGELPYLYESSPSPFLKTQTAITTPIRPFLDFSECMLQKPTSPGSYCSDRFLMSPFQLWGAGQHTGHPHPQPHSHVVCPGKLAFCFFPMRLRGRLGARAPY